MIWILLFSLLLITTVASAVAETPAVKFMSVKYCFTCKNCMRSKSVDLHLDCVKRRKMVAM